MTGQRVVAFMQRAWSSPGSWQVRWRRLIATADATLLRRRGGDSATKRMGDRVLAAFLWGDELAKAGVQLGFTAVIGGFIGIGWATSKRRREGRVAAQESFYRAYGRWYAIWKEWGRAIDATKQNDGGRSDPGRVPDPVVAALTTKAAEVEAEFEAIFVRLAVEHRLSAEEVRHLGQFREGVQELRNRLKQKRKLDWAVQSTQATRNDPYVLFKARTVEVARLVGGRPLWVPRAWFPPRLAEAQRTLVEVTSWRASSAGWYVVDDSSRSVGQARETLDRLLHRTDS